MVDESIARLFQDRYRDGERGALGGLYAELRHLAELSARNYSRTHGFPCDGEAIGEVAHGAASRIIERYLRAPSYTIRRFSVMVSRECRHILTEGGRANTPKHVWQRSMVSIEAAGDRPEIPVAVAEDKSGYISELADSAAWGRQAVFDLVYSASYRSALETIGGYAPVAWIRDNAVRLHHVYRMTRGKKGSARIPGRDRTRRDKAPVRFVRPEPELRGQRAAEILEQSPAEGRRNVIT